MKKDFMDFVRIVFGKNSEINIISVHTTQYVL